MITKSTYRRWRASWRDTVLLFREFRIPLLLFIAAIIGFGLLYHSLAYRAGEPVRTIPEAVYLVLGMTFLQGGGSFPGIWYLQLFYFLMPVIGIGILAQGLADFGVLFFNRRARGKDWEMAVASTYSNHIILIGLGHLGYHVVQLLHDMEEEVVVIELNAKKDLMMNIRGMGIPVIDDDGTRDAALNAAGITKARAIMLCTQNDALNLQMAVKARSMNPKLKVIIRIFDSDFARSLSTQFGYAALSATGMAAPIFAATAAGVEITAPITIAGRPNSLARLDVHSGSRLAGMSIDAVEDTYRVSIVNLVRDSVSEPHPVGSHIIDKGNALAVLGEPDQINLLVHDNH